MIALCSYHTQHICIHQIEQVHRVTVCETLAHLTQLLKYYILLRFIAVNWWHSRCAILCLYHANTDVAFDCPFKATTRVTASKVAPISSSSSFVDILLLLALLLLRIWYYHEDTIYEYGSMLHRYVNQSCWPYKDGLGVTAWRHLVYTTYTLNGGWWRFTGRVWHCVKQTLPHQDNPLWSER